MQTAAGDNKRVKSVVADLDTVYLGGYSVYKTDAFFAATAGIAAVNETLNAVAGALLAAGFTAGAYKVFNDDFALFLALSAEGKNGFPDKSVVFYAFDSYPVTYEGDGRFAEPGALAVQAEPMPETSPKRLYRTYLGGLNLPLLNPVQTKIVQTENANVLVQGVAGSGKTNICIDKIIFTSLRGYAGRTLYSTFSRGLLIDVKAKVDSYRDFLTGFISKLDAGKVRFGTVDKAEAIKAGLGLTVDGSKDIASQLRQAADYLTGKVDYMLLQDMYRNRFGECVYADEEYFGQFISGIKNYNLKTRIAKHSAISAEVLYKEIYGYIEGKQVADFDTYFEARKNVFTREEARFVYDLAAAYREYMAGEGAMDCNAMALRLAQEGASVPYSLVVLDEVQDFTEVQLGCFESLAVKMFCVGDAMQMVNPAYFSFARLKNLMYKKDVCDVTELVHNYRNSRRIAGIVQSLSDLNRRVFGVHSFVLRVEAVDDDDGVSAVKCGTKSLLQLMAAERTDDFTVVVANARTKAALRKELPDKEILTVAEIKGLERNTVVLYNLLTDSKDKWAKLSDAVINRKVADENSLYRYYFNLFYVGLSRAKKHLFVAEGEAPQMFDDFFAGQFEVTDERTAASLLKKAVGTRLVEQREHKRRAEEFARLGQYDNAYNAASHLVNKTERRETEVFIDVWRRYISAGDYRGAGIAFWEQGLTEQAKAQFRLAGEMALVDLVDATTGAGADKLNVDVVNYLPGLCGNAAAAKIIAEVLFKDASALKREQSEIADAIKKVKRSKGAGKWKR